MNASEYPPRNPRTPLAEGEVARHAFLVIGYRYHLENRTPVRIRYVGHLTNQRFILEPEEAASGEETLAMAWNDIIEFEFAAGSVAQEVLDGIDDAMLHCTAKVPLFDTTSSLFVFTVAPLTEQRPCEFAVHGQRFLELVEDLMLEAFESSPDNGGRVTDR